MGSRAIKVTAAMVVAFTITGVSEGCRTATQVELDVTYDGMCSDLQEVAFIIGTDPTVAEARIESNVFTTTTSHCERGSPSRVGSLVVTPNDATGRASIIVLASFGGQHVTECKPEKGYAGCIVARRAFAFVEHTALTLEIPLEVSCKNVPCDAVSTCKHASCVVSEVACSGSGCGEPGILPDGGTEFADAPMDPDAFVQRLDAQPPPDDGAVVDSSLPDVGTDAGADGASADADAASACPVDTAVACPAGGGAPCGGGSVCCAIMGAAPACTASPGCPAMGGYGTQLDCTATTDCAAGMVCCLRYNYMAQCTAASSCDETQTFNKRLCTSDCECVGGGLLDAGTRHCTASNPNGVNGVRACE